MALNPSVSTFSMISDEPCNQISSVKLGAPKTSLPLASAQWHELHLIDPRSVVPASNMPGYPWLAKQAIDAAEIKQSMKVLKMLGHPYTDEQIEASTSEVYGESKLTGLIAYLQYLGTAMPRSQQ